MAKPAVAPAAAFSQVHVSGDFVEVPGDISGYESFAAQLQRQGTISGGGVGDEGLSCEGRGVCRARVAAQQWKAASGKRAAVEGRRRRAKTGRGKTAIREREREREMDSLAQGLFRLFVEYVASRVLFFQNSCCYLDELCQAPTEFFSIDIRFFLN